MTPEKALWYMRMYGNACYDTGYYRACHSTDMADRYHILSDYILQRFERELKR